MSFDFRNETSDRGSMSTCYIIVGACAHFCTITTATKTSILNLMGLGKDRPLPCKMVFYKYVAGISCRSNGPVRYSIVPPCCRHSPSPSYLLTPSINETCSHIFMNTVYLYYILTFIQGANISPTVKTVK